MSAQGLVIQAAQSQLFVVEKGGADGKSGNVVPYWDWWKSATGENGQGQSWCAVFVSWCFAQNPKTANLIPAKNQHGFIYCPDLEKWAIKNKRTVTKELAQPGDIALFDFTHSGIAQHTEIVEKNLGTYLQTIGGNTSAEGDHTGSQSNGGGVYRRKRPLNDTIRLIVRPNYPVSAKGTTHENSASGQTNQKTISGI